MRDKIKIKKVNDKVFYEYEGLLLDPNNEEHNHLMTLVNQSRGMDSLIDKQKGEYYKKNNIKDIFVIIFIVTSFIVIVNPIVIGYVVLALSFLLGSVTFMDMVRLTKKINKNIDKSLSIEEQIESVEETIREELSKEKTNEVTLEDTAVKEANIPEAREVEQVVIGVEPVVEHTVEAPVAEQGYQKTIGGMH